MRKRRRNPSGGSSLCDQDFREAWERVRRNGGTAGVDGESSRNRGAGSAGWGMGRDLREGTYRPKAVKVHSEETAWEVSAVGRLAQSSAMLVGADLRRDLHRRRPGRSANEAACTNSCAPEVVDGDLSNYFGEIPLDQKHCASERGRMLADQGMAGDAVEEDDGEGGRRRRNRGRKQRKGTLHHC